MPIKPWTVRNTSIIHQTNWIEVVADECEVDGRHFTYTYSRRRDPGPMIIAEESDGRLWLVRQYRHAVRKVLWQFPAEGRPPAEPWPDAAKRGLYEELHKDADELIDLGELYPDPGGLDQVTHIFLARGLSESQQAAYQPEEVEELETAAFTLEEIDDLVAQGEIRDGWTLGALYLYKRWKSQQS